MNDRRNKITCFWLPVIALASALIVPIAYLLWRQFNPWQQYTHIEYAQPSTVTVTAAKETPLPMIPPPNHEVEVVEDAAVSVPKSEVPQDLGDALPYAIASKKVRTPESMVLFERTLYDVPYDDYSGFWALLRTAKPKDELIRFDEIAVLKQHLARYVDKMEVGLSSQEIESMFVEHQSLNVDALPYISRALERDIIVSNADEGAGYDLFTGNGEVLHFDFIEELSREAGDRETLWLHRDQQHWMAAVYQEKKAKNDGLKQSRTKETYFLMQQSGHSVIK
ncbi:MAG: hypothetical protein LBB11_01005 [Puniceicoccales bacterium]|jgi:hypothetical protein|nr:hypothetical protein [Puniceicoccales bacterium]